MVTPLVALFGFFAAVSAFIALLGHAARSNSPAPSMVTNNVSPIGWAIFFICILLALAAYQPAKAADCPPYDQCTPRGSWNSPSCKCWDGK